MSRRNNVRGPTSALTEFLRESGITPTTIARRARTREVPQPVAGPSNSGQDAEEENAEEDGDAEQNNNEGYSSDKLDEDEDEQPAPKKRKLSKAAEAKLKAKEKEKAKGKAKAKGKGKKGDDDDYEDDSDGEDAYTALSKMWKDSAKPPVGSFEDCARCKKKFTVTKYTLAANPPPGFLCHVCAKASGADPFKKPAAPRKRKLPGDKRTVVHFEERRFPSLASICIQLITRHIDDVEALGDIGGLNMDEISKSLARNRSLTQENVQLFYDAVNPKLTLYDATGLTPPAYGTLALLNPGLTHLRLDFCGRMDCTVMEAWSTALPNLKHLELLGPFLVRVPAWLNFIKAHRKLEGFLITQSPRFDLECMKALADNCQNLTELRLKEIGLMSDEFLEQVQRFENLEHLDISYPGKPDALSEPALIDLMAAVCGGLTHLDLSNNLNISDGFLLQGINPYAKNLSTLILSNTPDLTDAGVAEFFDNWGTIIPPKRSKKAAQAADANPPLMELDLSRNHELSSKALEALLKHSGQTLTQLSINGWRTVSQDALKLVAKRCEELTRLDIGWCREVDDWIVQDLMEKCEKMRDLKRNVAIQGIAVM
ncbi:hypothetical protein EIP91_005720 [Steccherinum ochraceum]|uniref:DNA repair protein rhp7 treble clef domain-containing protein n=1 Tax=Steccherinum ochraceum TaxID=92696 RepID=A0A4R0RQ74_9APHY|nr:hypothetical protein EIP91_005720 [Steccherinum ochraceum]